jgi:hypothetical protein
MSINPSCPPGTNAGATVPETCRPGIVTQIVERGEELARTGSPLQTMITVGLLLVALSALLMLLSLAARRSTLSS